MTRRFVILHHTGFGDEHWDLMIENGLLLWTWKLAADPTVPQNFPMPARRIQDHRLIYLQFEGPVSGSRGTVRRMDEGMADCLEKSAARLELNFFGHHLSGEFVILNPSDAFGTVIRIGQN